MSYNRRMKNQCCQNPHHHDHHCGDDKCKGHDGCDNKFQGHHMLEQLLKMHPAFKCHDFHKFHNFHDCNGFHDFHDFHDSKDCGCGDHHHKNFDPCNFLRCSPFQIRLAGLQGNLSFQLFRFKGCLVRITFECGGEQEEIVGRICNVGNEFVDIKRVKMQDEEEPEEDDDGEQPNPNEPKKQQGKVVTIMINKICKIEWLEKDCNPCKKQKHCCDPWDM